MIAYRYYVINKNIAAWVFGLLALLFQPLFKIALGRTIWNVIDVLVAILLIAIFVYEKRMEQKTRVHYQPLPPDDNKIIDGNKFTFQIEGKLGPKELIYVASEEDKELTDYFEKNPDVLEGWGKMIGFQIIYLPLLMKRLADVDVVRYRAPYLKDSELKSHVVGNDFLLEYLENPDDRKHIKQGFIRTSNIQKKGNTSSRVLSELRIFKRRTGRIRRLIAFIHYLLRMGNPSMTNCIKLASKYPMRRIDKSVY